MLISSKGRYALRLMIYIAALGDAEGKIALREVADRERISQKYLEQLVRPLMKAGLLKSVRGKGGGYMMATPGRGACWRHPARRRGQHGSGGVRWYRQQLRPQRSLLDRQILAWSGRRDRKVRRRRDVGRPGRRPRDQL